MSEDSLFGPEIAGFIPGLPPIPEAGGREGPRFSWLSDGAFGNWQPDPLGIESVSQVIRSDDSQGVPFTHQLRIRIGNGVSNYLTTESASRRFPMVHRVHPYAGNLSVESLAFSPVLNGNRLESHLPLHVIVFRCLNSGGSSVPASLLLTWPCGWPVPIPGADFDYQHDKLCISASMGAPGSDERMGLAIPDPDAQGAILHGMEPWSVPDEFGEIVEEFDSTGEISPRIASGKTVGAAAWVRSILEPGQTWETAIILSWHRPLKADGTERKYVAHLEKRRPDNAVVWLAEQAVQRFGADLPNYSYWMRELLDDSGLRSEAEDDGLWVALA